MVTTLINLLARLGMARDKAGHLLAGVPVALFGLVMGWLFSQVGVQPISAVVLACGLTFAITKEAADWMDNEAAKQAGLAPPHGVEIADALWGMAASAAVAVFVQFN